VATEIFNGEELECILSSFDLTAICHYCPKPFACTLPYSIPIFPVVIIISLHRHTVLYVEWFLPSFTAWMCYFVKHHLQWAVSINVLIISSLLFQLVNFTTL